MAKRNVAFDLDFNVQGQKSIGQLENTIEQINEEIKNVDTNSDAFKQLSSQAQQANSKLKTIDQSMEGVTSTEKAEGVVRLGEGLAGAFEAAAGASLLFGEQTSEELEKVIQQVGGLVAAMDGIRRVTEALSAENLRFVKAAVAGFKRSAVAAKFFGNATRAAVTATGLGIIITLIGLIIANWDKLTSFVKDNMESIKKYIMFALPPLYVIIEVVEAIQEKFGSLGNLVKGVGAAIKQAFTFDGSGLEGINNAFDETIEKQKEINRLEEERNELAQEREQLENNGLRIIKAQEDTEKEVLNVREQMLIDQKENLQQLKLQRDLTEDEKEELRDVKVELEIIRIKRNQINEEEEEAAEKRRKERREERQAQREAAQKRREELLNEIELLQKQNEIESDSLEFRRRLLEIERAKTELAKEDIQLQFDYLKTSENIDDVMRDVIDNSDVINNINEKRNEIENDYLLSQKEKDRLLDELEAKETNYLNEVMGKLQDIGGELNEEERQRLVNLQRQREELKLEEERLELTKNNNQDRIDGLRDEQEEIQKRIDAQDDSLEGQKRAAELTEEKQKLEGDIINLQKDNAQIERDNAEIQKDKNDLREDEKEIIAEIIAEQKKSGDQAEDNRDSTVKFIEDVLEFAKVGADAIGNIGELSAALNQRQIQQIEDQIIDARTELEEFYDYQEEREAELQEQKEENKKKEEELVELLRDAEGERYDQIKEQLAGVREAEQSRADQQAVLDQQQAEREHKLALLEWKREKKSLEAEKEMAAYRKAQAAIDATIQTTLAVIQALPNIPLSIAIGVMGAAGVASILAQPLPSTKMPPKPESPEAIDAGGDGRRRYAEGGYLDGKSHSQGGIPIEAEGGEYIVNRDSTSKYYPILEAINAMKFQQGGMVSQTTPQIEQTEGDIINYDRLAQAMANQPIMASWTEGENVGRRLKFTENRSSI